MAGKNIPTAIKASPSSAAATGQTINIASSAVKQANNSLAASETASQSVATNAAHSAHFFELPKKGETATRSLSFASATRVGLADFNPVSSTAGAVDTLSAITNTMPGPSATAADHTMHDISSSSTASASVPGSTTMLPTPSVGNKESFITEVASSLSELALDPRCANCCKSGVLRCTRCADGVDSHGQPSPTYYCGKDCQREHWNSAHKLQCKLANNCKVLYRVGALLQPVFYKTMESFWVDKVEKVEREDNGEGESLIVRIANREGGTIFERFPVQAIPDESDKRAVLVHGAGSYALHIMVIWLKSLKLGSNSAILVEEVAIRPKAACHATIITTGAADDQRDTPVHWLLRATLKDGNAFAIDFCHAQFAANLLFGHMQAVSPWAEYLKRISANDDGVLDTRSLGKSSHEAFTSPNPESVFERILAGRFNRADVICRIRGYQLAIHETALIQLTKSSGESFSNIVGLPMNTYQQKYSLVIQSLERALNAGSFVFVNGFAERAMLEHAQAYASYASTNP